MFGSAKASVEKIHDSRVFSMAVGIFLYAAAYRWFISPAGLYSGGFIGISQIIRNLLGLIGIRPGFDMTGLISYMMNIPLFILAFRMVGKKFVLRTVTAISLNSLLMTVLPSPAAPPLHDMLLNSLIGGAMAGYGLGMILRSGASSGGTDIIGVMLVKKYSNISVGKIALLVNILIYAYAALEYKPETAAYSIVVAFVNAMMLDRAYTQTIKETAFVVSSSPEVGHLLMRGLGRGVTSWDSRGEYTGQKMKTYMVTLDKHEIQEFRRILAETDPRAFVSIVSPNEVIGNFKKHLDT